jgi:DNA-binding NarL/FixJ family response regulator
MTVRVVVADDHPMFRYGLTAVLAQDPGIEVLASVEDGAGLLTAVAAHHPDVVITDLTMPGLDGAAAATRLTATNPEVAILVLTMHEDDDHLFEALRAGARGYLVKGADGTEIIRAVTTVASGDAVYGGPVAHRIIERFTGSAGTGPSTAFPELTPRERQVLELLATGSRNREIGRRLGMSEKTVRNHVSQVLLKLQVPDRTAAALKAREAGLGDPAARAVD